MKKENANVNKINCHAELDSASLMRFRIKSGMTEESGRSMVEMLGVLAIIGVLSIMGIAGYKAAMTRHRANELLNEASKRAVVVAGQISLNGRSPSLSEFNEKDFSGGSFDETVYGTTGVAAWANTDKQVTLSITGVDGSVCEQMKGAANGVIKGFAPNSCDSDNPNTVKLTYNNDLSPDDLADGNDTPAAEPCPEERQCGDTCCGAGNVCHHEGDVYRCCNEDIGECCDSTTSIGVSPGGECCGLDATIVDESEWGSECCPKGSTAYVYPGECCGYEGTSVVEDSNGLPYCCPAGSTGYTDAGECCGYSGTIVFETNDGIQCCPEGSVGYIEGECCEAGSTVIEDENGDTHCCPEGSTGWDEDEGECI